MGCIEIGIGQSKKRENYFLQLSQKDAMSPKAFCRVCVASCTACSFCRKLIFFSSTSPPSSSSSSSTSVSSSGKSSGSGVPVTAHTFTKDPYSCHQRLILLHYNCILYAMATTEKSIMHTLSFFLYFFLPLSVPSPQLLKPHTH